MKANVGGIDRILRIVAGLVLIALAVTGIIGIWGWIGIAPLLTGIFRFCPAYSLFGMSTCPMKKIIPKKNHFTTKSPEATKIFMELHDTGCV